MQEGAPCHASVTAGNTAVECCFLQVQPQVPKEVLQSDATEMERVLEAANTLVDTLDFARGQLDALTKAGHKRCAGSSHRRRHVLLVANPQGMCALAWICISRVTAGKQKAGAQAGKAWFALHNYTCKPVWCSAKASTATAALHGRVAELARRADLAQTLLGNLVPVSMRDLASTARVRLCSIILYKCCTDHFWTTLQRAQR